MRSVGFKAILTFHVLLGVAVILGIASAVGTIGRLPLRDFRAIALVASSVTFVFIYAIVAYRAFLKVSPLHDGEVAEGSQQEFVYHVHLLFDLLVFSPVLGSRAIPVPWLRLIYLGLGARLGANTYTSGIICDPVFVTVGHDSILGQDSLIVPHALEGRRLAHFPIRIGSNVTVGAHAVVLSGVTVGDDAIIATGAVVTKGTRIEAGEVWGGVPAKRLRECDPLQATAPASTGAL